MNYKYNVKTDSHRISLTYPQKAKLAIYSRVITRLTSALCALLILISLPVSSAYALTAAAIAGSTYFNGAGGCSTAGCHVAPSTGASAWTSPTTISLQPLSYYAGNSANFATGIAAANSPSMGNPATAGTNAANAIANSVNLAAYFAESYFAVPNAPTIGTATKGNAQATVTFSAPASALPITGYTVTANPAAGTDINAGTTGLSHVITGLTNGTSYTFTVTATSNAGTGTASAASNAVTPATVPTAPTIGTVTASNGQASVPFTFTNTVPSNGGATVTSYTVTPYIAGVAQATTTSGTVSPITVSGLTNGTAYTFKIAAVNSVGTGTASAASNSVTPATVPNAPTIGTSTASNGQTSVAFTFTNTVPSNGGAAVTSYTVTPYIAGVAQATTSGAASPITVTGLTNGTAYTFKVAAVNSVGTGTASGASNTVTPATVPNAPTIGTATAGDGQVSVPFTFSNTVPTNGGANVTSFTVTPYIGGAAQATTSGAASPISVNGLTNGTAYTFTVAAVNSAGTGAASAASNSVTPFALASAPTIGTATAGNGQATVPFTAPASFGTGTLVNYTVTPYVGATAGTPVTGLTSPILVTGLTNGTTYTFTIAVTTTVGTTVSPTGSNAVTPATVPNAPTIGTATSGNGQASVVFTFSDTVPTNGGATVTSYTVTPYIGAVAQATTTGAASPISVTGLTNGTTYTFTVAATNRVGTGAVSAASNSVTPATIPDAPAITGITSGNGQATIAFTAPAFNGGAAITSYTGNCGGVTATGASSPLTVTGLTNGTTYNCTVAATNIVGSSLPSTASSVTPATVPGAPTIVSATLGNAQVTVTFNAPASNGGAAITGYTVTSNPADGTDSNGGTTGLTHIVTNLTNGTAYTFIVTATNSVGSTASASSASVTPYAPPVANNTTVSVQTNSSANVITPGISGAVNASGLTILTPTSHGTISATVGNTFLYTPTPNYYGVDSVTYAVAGPGGNSGNATITITINPIIPSVTNAALQVQLNASATLDLAPYITGTAITGVSVSGLPLHGTAIVSGTNVTYVPAKDYSGTDSFTYLAYGAAGVSASAATVTVTIIGRPNPLQDPHVKALIDSQTAALQHFSAAQIANFSQRLESSHHAPYLPILTPSASGPAFTPEASAPLGTAPAVFGSNTSGQTLGRFDSWQANGAQSYTNNPNALLRDAEPSSGGNNSLDNTMASLMNLAKGLATNSSLNLGELSKAAGAGPNDPNRNVELWAAGNLRFGTVTQAGTNTQFVTDGVSIGADKRINRNLTLGMGVGYARDNSTIGTDGTNSKATGTSLAGYASYLMDAGTYLDGILGVGKVNFDTKRFVTVANSFARATRQGDQLFGSLAYGYEYRDDGVLWSPYGRYDFSFDRLNASTETGAGVNALSYASQSVHTGNFAFGMRGQTAHQTEYGLVQPRARLEYQHNTSVIGPTTVAYADLMATQYALAGTSRNSNSVVIGLGSDFLMSDTWKLGIDYQHLGSKGPENSQSLNVLLTKTLNGKNDFDFLLQDSESASVSKPSGLVVATGFSFDDNVNRASDAREKISDTIYSATVSKSFSHVMAKRHRLMFTGFLDTEQFRTYSGLNHVSAGLNAEYAFRPGADFGTPTYGVFLRATQDKFSSTLRNGSRFSTGVNFRDSLTDRISLFSALSDNKRTGKSDVFNARDRSARVNLDYALSASQTLYLGGEYKKGDVIASGWVPALNALNIATVFVLDDVFINPGYTDYRFKGRTKLFTLGYNIGFGPKDSIDLSWRRANSAPDAQAGTVVTNRYIDNQYSINYLMAF
ncbi:MAG: fibronectin type III domain-containing protein [Gallionella sp.]